MHVCYIHDIRVTVQRGVCITEMYRPVPGIELQTSHLTYERSTTELPRSYTILLFKFRVHSNYPSIVSCVRSATLEPYRVCGRGGGVTCV